MPEGHVIHRLARDHNEHFARKRLRVSSPQGRFAAGAEELDGKILRRIDAHGKHLFYHWQGRRVLHVHLGLYGRFRLHRAPPPEPRGEVRLRVVGRSKAFDLNGPNRCELLDKGDLEKLLQRLGPDPLRADADPQQAWQRIGRSRTAIGNLLLNQAVIAGVGNIYRADALFELGIHPSRPGNALKQDEFDNLWETLTRFMRLGLKHKRIINADPRQVGKPRSRMNRQEALLVYKRETCLRCDAAVESWELAGRTIYACPRCQPK
jgi:endonuclease-8